MDTGVIVLGYEPGPVHGLIIVIVDAPGFTQARFAISEHLKGSPEEQIVLRRMLEERRATVEAERSIDF